MRAAYVAGPRRPAVVRELGLASRGLRLLERDPSSFTPLPDGRGLLLGPDAALCVREIGRFSKRDAERYPRHERLLDRAARVFELLLDRPPPDPARLGLRDLGTLGSVAWSVLGLRRDLARVAQLFAAPAGSTLGAWFESEPLLSTLATDALIGAWAAPSTPSTGTVLFHHVMGKTGSARGVWAYAALHTTAARAASRWKAVAASRRPSSFRAPIRSGRCSGPSARGSCRTRSPRSCADSTSGVPS